MTIRDVTYLTADFEPATPETAVLVKLRHSDGTVTFATPVSAEEEEADNARWDPSQHPRHPPGSQKGGEFAPKAGGAVLPSLALMPVNAPAFTGEPRPLQTRLSKQQVGMLGERVVVSWLRQSGFTDADTLNIDRNNFPVDLVHDHEVVEVKTGLISNGTDAQKWRMTIGEPGVREKSWLARASARTKAVWNEQKQRLIRRRKTRALAELSQAVGRKLKGKTVGVILDPDRRLADIYVFAGFHDRIRWRSPEARKAYAGTFQYGD